MSKELTKIEQVQKLVTAYYILSSNTLEQLKFGDDKQTLMACARISGTVEGRILEHFKLRSKITLEKIISLSLDGQKFTRVVGFDQDQIRKMRAFLGHMSDHLEEAFDIALNDKPLPPSKLDALDVAERRGEAL